MVAFFESPEGAQMLQQLLVGAHFVITLLGSGGIRLVCQFLELSGLSAFIASSYGVQQRINAALEEAVVEHARMQFSQPVRSPWQALLMLRGALFFLSVLRSLGHGVIRRATRSDGQSTQFSSRKPCTRSNSRVLLVTRVAPSARAWQAIHRSLAPIGVPASFRRVACTA